VDFHERCFSLDHGNVFLLFSLTFSLSFTSVCFEQWTVDHNCCVDYGQQFGEHTYSGEPLFEEPTWVGLFYSLLGWTQRYTPARWTFCSVYPCFELSEQLRTTNKMDITQDVQQPEESTSDELRLTVSPSQTQPIVQSTSNVSETLISGFVSKQMEKLDESILTFELGHLSGTSDVVPPQSSCSPSRSTQVTSVFCFYIDFERCCLFSCFAHPRMEIPLYPQFKPLNKTYNLDLITFRCEPLNPCFVHSCLNTSYSSLPSQDTAEMDESDVEQQQDDQIDPNQVPPPPPSISFCVARPSPDYPEPNAPCFRVTFEQTDRITVKLAELLNWIERDMHMNVSSSVYILHMLLSQTLAQASCWLVPQFVMAPPTYQYLPQDDPEVPIPTTSHTSSRTFAQNPDRLTSRTATDYIASIDDRNLFHTTAVSTVGRILSSTAPSQVEVRVELENFRAPRSYVGLPPWPPSLLPPFMDNCLPDPGSPLTRTLQELFYEIALNLHRTWSCTSCGLSTDLRADVCPQCSFNCKGVKLSLYHTTLQCIPTKCPVPMDFEAVKLNVYSPCGRGHLYLDQAGRYIQPVSGHYVQDNLTEVLPKRTTRWTLHENQYSNNWMSLLELIAKHGLVLPLALNERVSTIEFWKQPGPPCEAYCGQARMSCFDWDNTTRASTSQEREAPIELQSTHFVTPATVLTMNDMSFDQWLQHHNYYIHLDLSIVQQCQSKQFQEYDPEWYIPESPYVMSPCYIALSQLQVRLQNFLNGSWLDPDKVPDPTSYYPRLHRAHTLDQCRPVVRQDPHVYLQWNIWLMTIACRQYHLHGRVFNASEFVHPDQPVTDYSSTTFCPQHAVNAHFCCRYSCDHRCLPCTTTPSWYTTTRILGRRC